MARRKLIQVGEAFNAAQFSSHCGIYAIVNTKTGRAYIGQSVDILSRWGGHYSALVKSQHSNKALMKDWYEYGARAFEFKVVETCKANELYGRERYWINTWQPTPYNLVERPKDLVLKPKPKPRTIRKRSEVLPERPINYEFVSDMFMYYTLNGMPPYVREIFDRWLALESTQDWVLRSDRI